MEEIKISDLISSPLNWYGGKGQKNHKKLVEFILKKIEESGKEMVVDVFGGGGTIALNCKNKAIIYNDKFEGLYNFFRVIQTDGEKLRKKIDTTLYCQNEYIRCRDNWKNEEDSIERARMFYVATMQGRTHTVVEHNKKSFRQSKDSVKKRKTPKYVSQWRTNVEINLPKCIDKFKEIEIWNIDALECIDKCDSDDFILYIDPPYIKSTRSTDEDVYEHEYTDEDHANLIEKLKTIKASVILSGYENELYNELLKFGWSKENLFYGKEVVWYKI